MNYRKWLIEDLQSLGRYRFAIKQMQKELETLTEEYSAIQATNYDKIPSGTGENSQEDKLINAIAKMDELQKTLKATRMHVEDMERLLNELPDDEQRVIQIMVIDREKYGQERISLELGFEKTQVYKLRNQALVHLAQLRYGKGYQT